MRVEDMDFVGREKYLQEKHNEQMQQIHKKDEEMKSAMNMIIGDTKNAY